MLGLGVRGVGWREIEIVRLPTGQPTVSLHDRALRRAEQLGMERIAVSISHEHEYAVAIAFGIRTAGGSYVFPLDIEARLDDRERQLLGRLDRLRELDAQVRARQPTRGQGPKPDLGSAAADLSGAAADPGSAARSTPRPRWTRARERRRGSRSSMPSLAARLLPTRDPRGHKGTFGRVLVVAGSLDYAGAALMSGAAALRSRLRARDPLPAGVAAAPSRGPRPRAHHARPARAARGRGRSGRRRGRRPRHARTTPCWWARASCRARDHQAS